MKQSSRQSRPHLVRKIAGVAPNSRTDAGKAHVIISEKRDKKASKYLVKDLPHPYTNKVQFESSLEQPVGAEWNTRTAFQKAILPRVVKKVKFTRHKVICMALNTHCRLTSDGQSYRSGPAALLASFH